MRDRSLALRLAVTLLLSAASPARAGKDLAVDDVQRNVPAGPQFSPELGGANVHNVGSIQMHVTNFGLLGSLPGSRAPYADVPSAQWPAGSGVEYLYGGGLWVGARVNGEARVSGIIETSERVQFEFRPGPTELDRIYRSREQAPGGARQPAINADDDGDRRIDEDRLDGRDNDGDGDIDEDYAAISNQMFYCEFADTDPAIRYAVPDHRPLGLHVEQTTLEWEGAAAAGFIGLDYRITNVGRDLLEEFYVGFFADFDVGGRQRAITSQDDLSGFWRGEVMLGGRSVPLELGYTFDDDGDDGSAEGYVGLVFLGYETGSRGGVHPLALRNYRAALGTGGLDAGGDATNDVERYAILEGSAARSLPPPDDPERRSEVARYIGDYRGVYSAGPLPPLAPGASVRFQAALVIAADLEALVERATVALQTFAGGWFNCDRDPRTGVLGRETPVCGPEQQGNRIRIDPCDADCDRVEVPPCTEHVPAVGCIWINDDCLTEIETGAPTGVDGRECLVNWLADSPPVPPGMRVVPREDRVEIYWDDTSEVTPDLLRGEYDFESYRLWRADGWTRPQGTNERSGPPHELWSLIGEYDLPRNRIGADTGLGPVSYAPQIPPTLVEFYRRWFQMHPDDAPPDVMGFTEAQLDTAQALAKGRRYYMFTDPPFLPDAAPGGACPENGLCPDVVIGDRSRPARCGPDGRCHATLPPPHPGMHLFYAVSATDHALRGGIPVGPGLAGDPAGNFLYVTMPSTALPVERAGSASEEVYVVPNPATPTSMAPWQLQPNNDDPTGLKVEFHHLPQSTGKVTIWTLAGDRVRELPFDGRDGNGTLPWDLVSRNGQDVASGVYLYTVEADDGSFERFVGKLVVVR